MVLVSLEREKDMRKPIRYLFALLVLLWTGILSALLVTLRYIVRTPLPLQSILPGEAHLYTWTHGQVYYHIFGKYDAPPLLLLHAPEMAASSYTMHALADGLAQHYRVYALDLPGFGQSDHPAITYSADMYVRFCRDFLTQVIGRSTTILACGLSGNYSIAVAQQEPALCERLILLSPTTIFEEQRERHALTQLLHLPPLGLVVYAILTRRPILRFVVAREHGLEAANIPSDALDHYVAVAHQTGAHYAPLAWLAGKLQLAVMLEQVAQPVLILWGIRALRDQLALANRHLLSPRSQVALIHDAGISVHEEQPASVVASILAWHTDTAEVAARATSAPHIKHKRKQEQAITPPKVKPTTPAEATQIVQSPPTAKDLSARQETLPKDEQIITEKVPAEPKAESLSTEQQPAVEAYCVKCKQKRPMLTPQAVVTKNGRNALEGSCPVCGTRLFRFVGTDLSRPGSLSDKEPRTQ